MRLAHSPEHWPVVSGDLLKAQYVLFVGTESGFPGSNWAFGVEKTHMICPHKLVSFSFLK